jgi:hypothetical protein
MLKLGDIPGPRDGGLGRIGREADPVEGNPVVNGDDDFGHAALPVGKASSATTFATATVSPKQATR